MDVGTNGGVEEGFGGAGEGPGGVEERAVEVVAAVDGDEGDKKGLGVGEFVVAEEGGEEGEERREGLFRVVVELGDVVVGPSEEGKKGVGAGGYGFGGEDGVNERWRQVGDEFGERAQ